MAADVAFDPELDTDEMDERITAIEDALMAADESVKKVSIEPETGREDGRRGVRRSTAEFPRYTPREHTRESILLLRRIFNEAHISRLNF